MSDCIFCKIANEEIPSDKIFESENILAFRDINPVGPTHILFIPKKHYATLNDFPKEEMYIMNEILEAVKETAKKEGVDQTGYRVITNVNKDAGQEVFHLHVHLIGGKRLGRMG